MSKLAKFYTGTPPANEGLQLLCEDQHGTYVLPFPCEWHNGAWHNLKNEKGGRSIEAKVIGWRPVGFFEPSGQNRSTVPGL
jgi:hypothetical protein